MGRSARAIRRAASEYASLPCTGASCRTPAGNLPGSPAARARQDDHIATLFTCGERGQEIAVVLRNSTMATECIGHQRQNAQRGSVHRMPAKPPPPERPSAAPRGTSRQRAQELAANAAMRGSRCSHAWIGVANPVLGRSITLEGSGTRGLFGQHALG